MSAERWAARPPALRLAAFAALAALAGAQWMRIVDAPPVGRVALAVAAGVAGAAALALIGARLRRVVESGLRPPGVTRGAAVALALTTALIATGAGLAAVGVPVALLEPRGWGELGDEIGRGFSGLAGKIEYPYADDNEWTRIVILAGLPVALGAAAALAFWPLGGSPRTRRTVPLVILVGAFTVGATIVPPAQPLLWGALLLAAVAAWLWLPSLAPRNAVLAAAAVGLCGVLAVPIAAALEPDEPWINYREWRLGTDDPARFDWSHSYGPLEWPRDGTQLAAMETERPQYWKAAILDSFDGRRWAQRSDAYGDRLELPDQVEGAGAGALPRSDSRWVEQIRVHLGPVESEYVLGAGATLSLDGVGQVIARADGATIAADEPLGEGDSYSFVSYSPNPTAGRLRGATDAYPSPLRRFTTLVVPGEAAEQAGVAEQTGRVTVRVPLRSDPASGDPGAEQTIASGQYAGVLALAQRLTADAATSYDAVKAIEGHLKSGRFTYNENPPSGRYPLADFLREHRIGYCQQFSGAMALMLRMVGIPSRVVSGFSPGTADPDEENVWRVEDRDAHSWVEVYFPEIGWVTFDPTTSGGPAAGRVSDAELGVPIDGAGEDGVEHRGRTAADGTAEPVAAGASGSALPGWMVSGGLGLAGALGLALGAIVTARGLRYRSLSPAAAAEAHLRELTPALDRLGWSLSPAETLLALEHRLRRYAKPAAARYVARLRRGRYSPSGGDRDLPTLADRRALRDDLSAGVGLRARLRGLLALPPGGPTPRP